MMTWMSSRAVEPTLAAARILRYARRRAGLSQRTLAAQSGVPQETIARIESGATVPRFDTIAHLLDACGLELEVVPRLGVGEDRTLIRRALAMEPDARLEEGLRAARGMEQLKDAWDRSRQADRGQ
jgi:transcriptional regulator with XRE-family HTH domain